MEHLPNPPPEGGVDGSGKKRNANNCVTNRERTQAYNKKGRVEMRKLKLCTMVAIAVAVTAPALGLSLKDYVSGSPMQFNLFDRTDGKIYSVADGTYTGKATLDAITNQFDKGMLWTPGEEDFWGIAFSDKIVNPDNESEVYWRDTDNDTLLVFIFYGGHDMILVSNADGQTTYTQGIMAKCWEVPISPSPWDPSIGPVGRDADSSGAIENGEEDYYTGISDVVGYMEPIFEVRGANLIDTSALGDGSVAAVSHQNTVNLVTPNAETVGNAYFEIFDVDNDGDVGSMGTFFDTDTISTSLGTCDIYAGFHVIAIEQPPDFDDDTTWITKSTDPILAAFVPEPATMVGVMIGIGGLLRYANKRRRS